MKACFRDEEFDLSVQCLFRPFYPNSNVCSKVRYDASAGNGPYCNLRATQALISLCISPSLPAYRTSRKHAYIILTPLKPHFYIVKRGFTGVYRGIHYYFLFCKKETQILGTR